MPSEVQEAYRKNNSIDANCKNVLKHKFLFPGLQWLVENGIRFDSVVTLPGDYIFLPPGAYHFGTSLTDPCVNLASNYANSDWMELAMKEKEELLHKPKEVEKKDSGEPGSEHGNDSQKSVKASSSKAKSANVSKTKSLPKTSQARKKKSDTEIGSAPKRGRTEFKKIQYKINQCGCQFDKDNMTFQPEDPYFCGKNLNE